MQKIMYNIWLSRLNLNPIKLKKILSTYNLEDIWNLDCKLLEEILSKEEMERIIQKEYRKDLEKYEKYMREHSIKLITFGSENYPKLLENIDDAPAFLYAIGNINLLKGKNIAIVGTRRCSDYGRSISTAFSYLLAKRGFHITSGLALGIDRHAHEGALMAQGKTIAVMGTGVDLIYPKENKDLLNDIIQKNGLVISEYPLGTKPSKLNFPRRNRIISGISKGVLVIEAGEKSGSLITTDYALQQGRDVYVIPRKHYKHKINWQ